ncbi:MAG: proline racemase family protein [Terriglobales bacterium]
MRLEQALTAVDLHACGEPGRVIVGGVLDVPGASMYEKMVWLRQHRDGLRLRMLREPRGYPAANCNLILPPTVPGADAGFVIMEQVEYPPMSGSNTICVATALAETGMVATREGVNTLRLEAPAGLIIVEVEMRQGKAVRVTFENVPAFAVHLGVPVEVRGVGTVAVDVAWGGMFYAIADAAPLGLRLTPDEARDIVRLGEMIKQSTREQYPVRHPENDDITGPTIAQLSAPAETPGVDRRNAVIVSTGTLDWAKPATWTGTLDRSSCGTGTCAKMAALHARGHLGLNQDFVHAGILGTTFSGRLLRETQVGPHRAVVPTISGQAWITGFAQYVLDPTDPFPEGFTVGDLWGGQG